MDQRRKEEELVWFQVLFGILVQLELQEQRDWNLMYYITVGFFKL